MVTEGILTKVQNNDIYQLIRRLNNCLIITMINPCFDASDIESKDKNIYTSLKNNVNRVQNKQLTYFCSLVNKKGRIISFVSHMRLLVLLAWKDRPHKIGYIEAMRNLPPWSTLPNRKFQKQLKTIKTVTAKDKVLEISFHDEEQNWQLECQSKGMAKKWQNLIQNHIKLQSTKLAQPRNIQTKAERRQISQMTLYISQRLEKNARLNSTDQKQTINEASPQRYKVDTQRRRQGSNQNSSEASSSYVQLSKKYSIEHEYWLNKESEYKYSIQRLEQQNKNLKVENDQLKNLNKQIREETARLKISKSVLSLLKEQYEKKHLQFAEIINRKNFQINMLFQKCADLILIKDGLEKNLKRSKQRQMYNRQHEQQDVLFDSQLSSSSNDSSKLVIESQHEINCKQENTQTLLTTSQRHRSNPSEALLARQNTIY